MRINRENNMMKSARYFIFILTQYIILKAEN